MASNDYDIVNLALVRLGANRITSLSDGSKNANEANAIYALIRDDLLREHPWSFATRYENLFRSSKNVLTVSAITKANPGKVTYTGTDPADGDKYLAENIGGMTQLEGIEYIIHAVNGVANTFELYSEGGEKVNTTTYTTYTSGGTFTRVLPHTDEWDFMYDLPATVLRVFEINDDVDEDYEVVQDRYLMCNSDECQAKFILQVTDVTKYDPSFVNVFAWRLAMELAMAVTGDGSKLNAMSQQFNFWFAKSTSIDAREGRTKTPRDTRYSDSRR